jgi:hypothetical protein
LPCIVKERTSGLAQLRGAFATVEERDAESRLKRLHGLAYRRLNSTEAPRGGRKASRLGDCDENAQLVQCEAIKHSPSIFLIDTIIILPILKMERALYIRAS